MIQCQLDFFTRRFQQISTTYYVDKAHLEAALKELMIAMEVEFAIPIDDPDALYTYELKHPDVLEVYFKITNELEY
ncbi:hypothetical protein [Paenibacillus sp. UMB4589-SE434]|uniref:hypothetical protein n=1 Tax=Paenibacillus sp. UMB4589-SE434 TaxID=3046314 RepID=UPI00254E3C21|nr:hypothetical protein [Paenibacillus sp. UMB4589-SE434]MDK8182561.1 hypothetical protein [Paenibacillus sp. UMB4589-SE434]